MQAELVITGFGAVGSFGGSCDALCQALAQGRQLVSPSPRLGEGWESAEIVDFDLARFRRTAKGHRAPRLSQYALAAAAQAISAAQLEDKRCSRDEVAVVYGTGNGPGEVVARNLDAITRAGLGAIEPLSFQESVFNAPASLISIEYGFRGPLLALPMGWAAGGHAMVAAAELIRAGHAEVVLVIASDEVNALTHDASCALGLARVRDAAPLRRGRRQLPVHPSEGGAAAVVETRAHALRRGATPLLVLAGWSVCSDAFGVGPKGRGPASLALAMKTALAQSALSQAPEHRVSVVYAGSYCTEDADRCEKAAMEDVFGPADCPSQLNLRHVIGEAKAPTALFNLIAAEARLRGTDHYGLAAADAGANANVNAALCNAFWVNGTNTSLLVRRPE